MGIEIINPGPLTSVQDEGRFGLQRIGMSPAGAMDTHSMILANLLVGNDRNTGTLECTVLGPTLRLTEANVIAVTGANMAPTLDGAPLEMGRAYAAPAGSVLKLGAATNGVRSYIAFHGGLDVPVQNGSQSTLLRTGFGGFQGRKLQKGDVIGFRAPAAMISNLPLRYLPQPQQFAKDITVRVIPGPQDDRFTAAGQNTFYSSTYTITPQSNRMAYRTEGPKVEHTGDANIISDGIPLGAVQIPGSGVPIVMMAEHQGSGGYTKIANIITADIPLVAQCAAGGTIRFVKAELAEAQAVYLAREEEYKALQDSFNADHCHLYQIHVNGQTFTAAVERLD